MTSNQGALPVVSAPISGMTGFGRSEGVAGDVAWVWEIRSVNGRNLDVKFRTPPGYDGLETRIREACARRFKRGSVHVALSAKKENANTTPMLKINHDLIAFYLEQSAPYVTTERVALPSWDGLMALRGVIETTETIEADEIRLAREASLLSGLEQGLDRLAQARLAEGAMLHKIFTDIFDKIDYLARSAAQAADDQVKVIRDRVQKRAAELLGDVPFDDVRLLQEAAALALKADVREELDRLASHVEDARNILLAGGDIGRKLEFLAQEFHREANTLTAKAAAISLTRVGLELKATVDQLKEQSANVE